MGDMSAGLDYVEFYEREFDHIVHAMRPSVGPAAEDIAQEAFIAARARSGRDRTPRLAGARATRT